MLICALKEQLELLITLKSFEVDMSYKRLKAAKLNEVVFTTYLPNHGKSKYLLLDRHFISTNTVKNNFSHYLSSSVHQSRDPNWILSTL